MWLLVVYFLILMVPVVAILLLWLLFYRHRDGNLSIGPFRSSDNEEGKDKGTSK